MRNTGVLFFGGVLILIGLIVLAGSLFDVSIWKFFGPFLLILLGLPDMPDLGHGHPDIVDFPAYAQDFYNSGHSLFVFASCFALVWLIRRKVLWPLAGWGIHILIDIPTHSLKLFPTPFLWPFSSYKMDGIAWRSPSILLLNFSALAIAYCLWLYQRRSAGKRRDRPSV